MSRMHEAIKHLVELRKRLLRCLLIVAIVFIVFAFVADKIYLLFSLPILQHLPDQKGLIATSVPAPFLVPFKSALVLAIYVTVPYWLYEACAFISPALYKKERKLAWVFVGVGSALFYLGTLFAYFMVVPLVLHFFIHIAPSSVKVMPDISQYFGFVFRLLMAFGLAFEMPMIVLLLVRSGMTSVAALSRKRPYIILGAFIIGMLLTPPDIFSQILLAIPMWLLFEFGLLLARWLTVDEKVGVED